MISCDRCGYMQLKRDAECDACGRMTKRERRLWIARGVVSVWAVIVGVVVFGQLKGLAALA